MIAKNPIQLAVITDSGFLKAPLDTGSYGRTERRKQLYVKNPLQPGRMNSKASARNKGQSQTTITPQSANLQPCLATEALTAPFLGAFIKGKTGFFHQGLGLLNGADTVA
jgi:hypothetical protein